MPTRILTLAFSCIASLGFFAFFALRGGRAALRTSDQAAKVATDPLLMSKKTKLPESRPVSLQRPTPHRANAARQANAARPIEVSERQFDRLVSQGLVLIKFGADWCGPCRRIVPELEQLAAENSGSLTVLTVDVDKEKRLARRHGVGPIPRMILFRDGTQVDQWTGFESASRMQRLIDKAKASEPKGDVQANPFAA